MQQAQQRLALKEKQLRELADAMIQISPEEVGGVQIELVCVEGVGRGNSLGCKWI